MSEATRLFFRQQSQKTLTHASYFGLTHILHESIYFAFAFKFCSILSHVNIPINGAINASAISGVLIKSFTKITEASPAYRNIAMCLVLNSITFPKLVVYRYLARLRFTQLVLGYIRIVRHRLTLIRQLSS